MSNVSSHATVIGGSIAGLLAARVLSESYEHVMVFDRDRLAPGADPRGGVPQGRHVHALLPTGSDALEELFPGLGADLQSAGATTGDGLAQLRWNLGGHRFRRSRLGIEMLCMSRPMLEDQLRSRTAALPNVELVDRCDILGLTGRAGRVDGLRVLRRTDGSAEEVVSSDLVVDCSGRGSRTPAWLEAMGLRPPAEERTHLGLGYASRTYRFPVDALDGDRGVLITARAAGPLRGGAIFRIEGDRWLVTLSGMLGDHPPTDDAGFTAFAATLAAPDIHNAIAAGEPLDDVAVYKYPATVRRRYERLRTFPAGLLVMGDAVASFNPIYGQGMTVAALQALELRRLLKRTAAPPAARFFAAAAKPVGLAWDLALGADLSYPQIEGVRTRRTRWLNRYVGRVHAAATRDAAVAAAFVRVSGMTDPPQRLLAPRIVWRTLRSGEAAPVEGGEHPGSVLTAAARAPFSQSTPDPSKETS